MAALLVNVAIACHRHKAAPGAHGQSPVHASVIGRVHTDRVDAVKDVLQLVRGGHPIAKVRPELVPRDDAVVILIDAPEQVVDNLQVHLQEHH